jgi:hypothetical protein
MGFRPSASALDSTSFRASVFGRVNQQHNAVDHRQDAFDYRRRRGRASTMLMRVPSTLTEYIGQNGDTALALDIVAVHGAFWSSPRFAVNASIASEALVHQRFCRGQRAR